MIDFIRRNIKIIIIFIVVICLSIISITFAQMLNDIGVTIETGQYNVIYTGEATLPNIKLLPIYDSELLSSINVDKVMKVEFTVKGAQNNPNGKDIIYDVSLTNLDLPPELKSEYLKWRLYKNGTKLTDGSFSVDFDMQIDNRMLLTTIQQDLPDYSESVDSYVLYIWLSESCVGDISQCTLDMDMTPLLNKSFSGEVRIELSTGSKKGLSRMKSSYFVFNDNDGSIINYVGDANDVTIPDEINGTPVTVIGDNAFNGKSITSITIPDGVTTIGMQAFQNTLLKTVTIPGSVKEIGDYAFRNMFNRSLEKVVISEGVERIGSYAFCENSITSLSIPSSVTSIGHGAFNDNKLPDEQAFIYARNSDGTENKTKIVSYGGEKTQDVIIPDGVITIGLLSFYLNNITSVIIPDTVEVLEPQSFYKCKITELVIPSSVKKIGYQSFRYNKLTTVTINGSVTIGNLAFGKSSNSNPDLTTIYNNTGNSFDWNNIIKAESGTSFVTGIVENDLGNVTITNSTN